jgi:hypothetical protein
VILEIIGELGEIVSHFTNIEEELLNLQSKYMVCEADIKKFLNSIHFQNQSQNFDRPIDPFSHERSTLDPTIDESYNDRRTNSSPSNRYKKYNFS